MKINEKIRIFREMNALTQEEMANQLQLSLNGYANIERGETKLSVERLEQIANIFGVDVTDLMAYGEHHTILNNHSTHNWNIIGSASEALLETEIDKLRVTIDCKDEIIDHLKREIETLKLLIDTLRNSK